ncbi:MAG: hypothetical protein AAFV86_19975 [Pseudomonadota bacterium]
MTVDTMPAPTLFDLLARHWTLPGPVVSASFNRDETAVAFATQDSVAIATMADPERPETRVRLSVEDGRRTILPRKSAVRPTISVAEAAAPLVPLGDRQFLAASTRGGLVRITPRGLAVRLRLDLGGGVSAIARDPASRAVAVGSGDAVHLLDAEDVERATVLPIGEPITALAFAPSGGRLAVGHARGVSFVTDGVLGAGVALDHAPVTLSFSPDGRRLACGFDEPGFALIDPDDCDGEMVEDFPTPVRSFAWAPDMSVLAASGAFRVVAWALEDGHLGDALHAGRNGLVIVERVAANPVRPLIAGGYANGLIAVVQTGANDEMVLRADGAPVSALAWSADGEHLAIGDTSGNAAIASFPPDIFK